MSVHPSVLHGFGRVAKVYERSRPAYPPEAIAWLAERLELRPGATVVDLAAGTGKLTRLLTATGARVVAVEPVEAMRAELERLVQGVEALEGVAERIPLPDRFADAVTVAQAFHWFAADEALAEISRVLQPNGRLGLVWNVRDQSDPLQRALSAMLEPLRGTEQTHSGRDWEAVLEASPLFGPVETARFRHEQRLDADALADRVASISFVAVLPVEQRAELDARVRALVPAGEATLPHVTKLFACAREEP